MTSASSAIAMHHSRAKGTARLVLIGIAEHDGDGGSWPSVETLSIYANVHENNVRTAVIALEKLGEVKRHMQGGGSLTTPDHQRPNRYEFILQCPPECDGTKKHRIVCPGCGKALRAPLRALREHPLCKRQREALPPHGGVGGNEGVGGNDPVGGPPTEAVPEITHELLPPVDNTPYVLKRASDCPGRDRPGLPHEAGKWGTCVWCFEVLA